MIFGPRPRLPVEGDHESAVDPDTIKELVALAKADKREDFDFLAGAVGVPAARRDELWTGTRARLNKPVDDPPPAPGRWCLCGVALPAPEWAGAEFIVCPSALPNTLWYADSAYFRRPPAP